MSVWVLRSVRKGDGPLAGAVLLDRHEHIELCRDYAERSRAGASPKRAWDLATGALRRMPTWQMPVLLAVEARRLALGWSGEFLSRKAGVAERAYHKWVRPWRATDRPGTRTIKNARCGGRVATRATVQFLVDAVEADGRGPLKVKWCALTRAEFERKLENLIVRHQRGRSRLYDNRGHAVRRMRELSPLGVAARVAKQNPDTLRLYGMRGGWAAADALTPEQRRARAKKAAKARWDRVRADYARWAHAHGGTA